MNNEELRCVQAFLGMSLRGAQRRGNPYPWLSLWESWHGEAVTERASSATHFPSAGRGEGELPEGQERLAWATARPTDSIDGTS